MALQLFVSALTLTCLLLSPGCQSEMVCGIGPGNITSGGWNMSMWPWQVTIKQGNSSHCGGSLISDLWVLSSASCVYNLMQYGEIMVHLNGNYSAACNVSNVTFHEHMWHGYDIGLVKLESPVEFSNYVHPICLPTQNSTFYTGMPAWVTSGYGSYMSFYNTLSMLGQEKCDCYRSEDISENTVCATGYRVGPQNDGGPLMTQEGWGDKWVQAGIDNHHYYGWDYTQTFTSVAFYEDWIKENTMGNQPGFVVINEYGFDPDMDFDCDDDSVFGGGETLAPTSRFISLCVPLLFFYLLL